jgi:hypothetical protein
MLATFFGRQGSELAPEDAADLNAHLAGCSRCADAVRFERAFDNRIAKAMVAVPVPAALKAKLLDGIATQQAAWYRHKAYGLVALAASVFVVVGGVIAWQIWTAPDLTIPEIVAQADDEVHNRARMAEEVLGPLGLRFDPELPINLNLLEHAGTGQLRGREVPVLYLVNPEKNARAKVYVVRDSDFQWKKLPGLADGTSGLSRYGFQVAVLKDKQRSDVGYIVVFTGSDLELFLEGRSSL